ncbi:MAG: hypothetical protein QNJ41_09375 [Xenococcaceae cyanobacterium MO_188.B32]|nr:hypothetical protein [Xenococcaceae cyanobacterium MO_188.B32]
MAITTPPCLLKEFGSYVQCNYDIGRIQRLCYYLDDLISRSTKVNAKKRCCYGQGFKRRAWDIPSLIGRYTQS